MFLIIIWYSFCNYFWPQTWPQPPEIGLGLGLEVLASFNITGFHCRHGCFATNHQTQFNNVLHNIFYRDHKLASLPWRYGAYLECAKWGELGAGDGILPLGSMGKAPVGCPMGRFPAAEALLC